jgi:protein gp37
LPGGISVTPRSDRLNWPLKWKKPKLIFTSSMTDLFHEDVPFDFLVQAIDVMKRADWHTFQILTKRPDRMKRFFEEYGEPPANAWLGTSVENQRFAANRLAVLVGIPGRPGSVRFASCEPILGPLDLRIG